MLNRKFPSKCFLLVSAVTRNFAISYTRSGSPLICPYSDIYLENLNIFHVIRCSCFCSRERIILHDPLRQTHLAKKKVQLSHRRDFANYKLVRYPVFFFNFFLLKPIIILLLENGIRFVDWFIIMIQFLISLGSTVTTNQKHLK